MRQRAELAMGPKKWDGIPLLVTKSCIDEGVVADVKVVGGEARVRSMGWRDKGVVVERKEAGEGDDGGENKGRGTERRSRCRIGRKNADALARSLMMLQQDLV